MKCKMTDILAEKKFVLSASLMKIAKEKSLTLPEFLLLIYFANEVDTEFNPFTISKVLSLQEEEVLEAFQSLLGKGLIGIDMAADYDGRQLEKINLNNLYLAIEDSFTEQTKAEEKQDIYKRFEEELGRTISPMEYEYIGGWLESGIAEDLILGALKEAVYNRASNYIRYIDKIIYDWNRKGYKTMEDVKNASMQKQVPKQNEEFLDYNWLEEDEDGND